MVWGNTPYDKKIRLSKELAAEMLSEAMLLGIVEYYSQLYGVRRGKIISTLFGISRLRTPVLSGRHRRDVLSFGKKFAKIGSEVRRISSLPDMTDNEKVDMLYKVFERERPFFGVPEASNVLIWALGQIPQTFQKQVRIQAIQFSFLKRTAFLNYNNVVVEIVKGFYSQSKGPSVGRFIDEASRGDDILMIVSSSWRFAKQYGYMGRGKRQVGREVVERYVLIYHELAGTFEKQLRILVGLLRIAGGEEPSYQDIRKDPLAANLEKLKNSMPFDKLVAPFKKTIRNAIAHGQYKVSSVSREVEFSDLKEKVRIGFMKFIDETKELGAVVLALLNIYLIRQVCDSKALKEMLERITRK